MHHIFHLILLVLLFCLNMIKSVAIGKCDEQHVLSLVLQKLNLLIIQNRFQRGSVGFVHSSISVLYHLWPS